MLRNIHSETPSYKPVRMHCHEHSNHTHPLKHQPYPLYPACVTVSLQATFGCYWGVMTERRGLAQTEQFEHHALVQVTVWVFINGCTGKEACRQVKNNSSGGLLVCCGEGLRGSCGKQHRFYVLLLPEFSADFFSFGLKAFSFFCWTIFVLFRGLMNFNKICV